MHPVSRKSPSQLRATAQLCADLSDSGSSEESSTASAGDGSPGFSACREESSTSPSSVSKQEDLWCEAESESEDEYMGFGLFEDDYLAGRGGGGGGGGGGGSGDSYCEEEGAKGKGKQSQNKIDSDESQDNEVEFDLFGDYDFEEKSKTSRKEHERGISIIVQRDEEVKTKQHKIRMDLSMYDPTIGDELELSEEGRETLEKNAAAVSFHQTTKRKKKALATQSFSFMMPQRGSSEVAEDNSKMATILLSRRTALGSAPRKTHGMVLAAPDDSQTPPPTNLFASNTSKFNDAAPVSSLFGSASKTIAFNEAKPLPRENKGFVVKGAPWEAKSSSTSFALSASPSAAPQYQARDHGYTFGAPAPAPKLPPSATQGLKSSSSAPLPGLGGGFGFGGSAAPLPPQAAASTTGLMFGSFDPMPAFAPVPQQGAAGFGFSAAPSDYEQATQSAARFRFGSADSPPTHRQISPPPSRKAGVQPFGKLQLSPPPPPPPHKTCQMAPPPPPPPHKTCQMAPPPPPPPHKTCQMAPPPPLPPHKTPQMAPPPPPPPPPQGAPPHLEFGDIAESVDLDSILKGASVEVAALQQDLKKRDGYLLKSGKHGHAKLVVSKPVEFRSLSHVGAIIGDEEGLSGRRAELQRKREKLNQMREEKERKSKGNIFVPQIGHYYCISST